MKIYNVESIVIIDSIFYIVKKEFFMSNNIKFELRDINEYKSTLGPKLLLIAEKPLIHDKNEIFDSKYSLYN